jgi:hypothetical protein
MRDDISFVCDKFQSLLEELVPLMSDRKLRLFCVACCRRFWSQLDIDCRRLVELTENYSDGTAGAHELFEVRETTIDPRTGSLARACAWATAISDYWTFDERTERWTGHIEGCITELVQRQTWYPTSNPSPPTWRCLIGEVTRSETIKEDDFATGAKTELRYQMFLARDIFGDPSRGNGSPTLLPYAMHYDTISTVATKIYQDHRFSDLPVLADALEDVGCTDSAVLSHCRSTNEHARGCWVLDLLLGKR